MMLQSNGWKKRGLNTVVSFCLALMAPQALLAGEQGERALAAVAKLLASGEVAQGALIKVAFKPGNINALLGPELQLQKEWERRTGVMISAKVIPQQPALTNLRTNVDIDLTVARTHEFPDLLDQNLVEDLTPLLKRFQFSLSEDGGNGFIRPRLQGNFDDRVVAIPADGDVAIMYLRRDLLESQAEAAAFRKATGRQLAIPRTWQDYEELVKFFHRPDQGLHGAAEERDPDGGWMFWLPRYFSQGQPYRTLFDASMRPLIDSPAGIAATESYIRTVRYSPPGITDEGKDYSFVLPLFMQGKAFSAINTIAGAKLFNGATSAVKGKFIAVPMPGTLQGNKLNRKTTPIYGNNLVVASHGKQPLLAFLFAMWLTDPDNSLRTVGVTGGHTDPYRWHQLADPRIRDLYTPEALQVFSREWAIALPPGTGVPGDGDYLAALDKHLSLAAQGRMSAAEAMKLTAAEWNRLTDLRGRGTLIAFQRKFLNAFTASEALAPTP